MASARGGRLDLAGLIAELRRGTIHSAYAIATPSDLLRDQAIEAIRGARGGGSIRRFEAAETKAADLIETQRNISLLFDPIAAIVVRRTSKLVKAEADALAEALADSRAGEPPMVFTDATIDRRLKLYAAIARGGGFVDIGTPNRGDAKRWVVTEANRIGHRLAPGVPDALVEALGTDLLQMRRALEVVSLGVSEKAVIGLGDVSRFVPGSRSHATYELQDAITDRDGARSVRLLRAVLDEGQEPPVLVGALFAALRRLRLALELPRGADRRSAATTLGVPEFRVERITAGARRFTPTAIERAIDHLADLDVAFKSGRGRPAILLEDWLLALCVG